MIIDSHIHYAQGPGFEKLAQSAGHEFSERHLREQYSKHGIRHAVVMGNRGLDPVDHSYPDFMSYCVGLDRHTVDDAGLTGITGLVEKHLQRDRCVGVKLYPGYNPHYVTDKRYEPFVELAQAYGKPVAIHTGATAFSGAMLKYSHPLTLDELAARHPQASIVMCHFGNPWLVDAAAVLSKNPNVSADLSGILEGNVDIAELCRTNGGFIEQLRTWIAYVGDYSRFLYGTDWPLVNIAAYIEFVRMLIPERHHDAVFWQNANRIYGLGL